jgi:hypothetical protein
LGGGPGFRPEWVPRLAGQRVIAVNDAYKLGQWDVLFWGDGNWGTRNRFPLLNWAGLKVTRCASHLGAKGFPDVKVIACKNAPHQGLTNDRGWIVWNNSSGAAAVNLALHFGVRRIVLLGFDMRLVETCGECGLPLDWPEPCGHAQQPKLRGNWHDNYKVDRSVKQKIQDYEKFRKPWPHMVRDLERAGVEIVNATYNSALDGVVPFADPLEVLPAATESEGGDKC